MKLTSPPRLYASMDESPAYRTMGMGLTDRLFLLGHAPVQGEDGDDLGMPLNEPVAVVSLRDTIDLMRDDIDAPLLKAMLQAYYSGARDIWVMAVAPMNEWAPVEERDLEWYETYHARLEEAYKVLVEWDIAQFTVPVGAPFNDYAYPVDFLGQLAAYCVDGLITTGEIRLGFLGTQGPIDADMIDLMASDGRLQALGDAGKFVSVFVGEGTFHFKELTLHHTDSFAVAAAAELSHLPLDRGLTNKTFKNVLNVQGRDIPKSDVKRLAEVGLNVVGRNVRGRRGNIFQIIPFTDNTLAADGSDYWSLLQMRLVSQVSRMVRGMGNRALGTIGYQQFKTEVEDYLLHLTQQNTIREYDLQIERDPYDTNRVLVELSLTPYYGVREVYVNVEVGPGR